MAHQRNARKPKKNTRTRLLRRTHDLVTSCAAALTTLGDFFKLPRELRDEIYSHVCNQKPYEFSRESDDSFTLVDRKKWWGYGLPMLQVSRTIREEFQAVLYSEGLFAISYPHFSLNTVPKDIPFLNDICNITILNVDPRRMSDNFRSYLRENPSPSDEDEMISASKAEPVSYLAGKSVTRNTCVIQFGWCGTSSLLGLLSSPFMRAMSQLTGFKTVQLHFLSNADNWLQDEVHEDIRIEFYRLGTCPGFEALVLRTSTALEQSLGSFTVKHGRWLDECRYWDQRVTFHPRGHPPKKADRYEADLVKPKGKTILADDFLEWTSEYDQ